MSDRFVLHAGKEEVEKMFGATVSREDYFDPNYNIHPGNRVPILIVQEGERQIHQAQWGLIPEEAEEETEGRSRYQFRGSDVEKLRKSETIHFSRRCVIPASGFYKWKTSKKKNTPFYIRSLSRQVMGLAGVYSVWESEMGRDIHSFAMFQTEANSLVQPVDDHMPVILDDSDFDRWLEGGEEEARQLIKPYMMADMAVNRVTEKVNRRGNNSPDLIRPIPK